MITFGGNPLTLVGNQLKLGDKAQDFTVLNNNLEAVKLSDYKHKVKVISVVPSLDTSVCDFQTRNLNEKLTQNKDVVVLTISNDLPFAQARWCGNSGLTNVVTLSDYKDLDFANKYGTLVKELRLQTRAVFVLDENNVVKHVEYLTEIKNHPNYDAVINSVDQLL
ncbi:MAG: hypothetical protein K0Q49_987 [Haloplasmataceae bacterium]|jgi:thiol peroxidase|nr:hypothetical protein [Haloplasmataceae bacterium]